MKVSSEATGAFNLRLEDDGREFDLAAAQNSDGRGLANMRARAKLIDAEISWVRREGGGTVFTLRRSGKGSK
jgi:signal transduction histidine kinase